MEHKKKEKKINILFLKNYSIRHHLIYFFNP